MFLNFEKFGKNKKSANLEIKRIDYINGSWSRHKDNKLYSFKNVTRKAIEYEKREQNGND